MKNCEVVSVIVFLVFSVSIIISIALAAMKLFLGVVSMDVITSFSAISMMSLILLIVTKEGCDG